MTDWREPEITINGVRLTQGQAMTLRVALNDFMLGTGSNPELGEIGRLYVAAGHEILTLMHREEGS